MILGGRLRNWKMIATGIGVAGLAVVGYLFWTNTGGGADEAGIPNSFRLHNYPGESLLDLDDYAPKNESNKVLFEGHTYELRLTFDKKYINPTPGSTITGTIEWLEDGKPLTTRPAWAAKKPNQAFPVAVPVDSDGKALNPYARSLTSQGNKPGIEAADGADVLWVTMFPASLQPINPSRQVVIDGQSRSQTLGGSAALIDLRRGAHLDTQIYSQTRLGRIPTGRGTPELDRLVRIPLELIDGKAQFTYVFDGARTFPFVQFRVDSTWIRDERDVLAVSRAVFFEDQVGRVSTTPVRAETKGELYYEISPSASSVREGEPSVIRLALTARDSRTNRVVTDASQRVRLMVRPAKNTFGLSRVEYRAVSDNSLVPDRTVGLGLTNYLNFPAFSGTLNMETYGRFSELTKGSLAPTNRVRPAGSQPDRDFINKVRDSLNDWLAMFSLNIPQLTLDQEIQELNQGDPDALEALRQVIVAQILSQADTSEAGGGDIGGVNSIIPPFMSNQETFLDFYEEWKSGNLPLNTATDDPRYIDIDLDNGQAEVDFVYNGKVGNQPIITFEAQLIPTAKSSDFFTYQAMVNQLGEELADEANRVAAALGTSSVGLHRNQWRTLDDPIFDTHTIYQIPIR